MSRIRMIAIVGCLLLQLSTLASAQIKDEPSDALIKQLEDKDVEKRRDAAYELVRRGSPDAAVIGALSKAASDSDTQVQVQALTGLARAGKQSEPTIPELIKCLTNRDDQVRYRAAVALGAIGTASIEPITTNWDKASTAYKIAAAQALASIGPEAKSAIKLLSEGLEDKEGLPRYAAEALVAISPQDEAIMLKIAENADARARLVGISSLAAFRSPSDLAIRKLQSAASDSEPKIRETAIMAVAKSNLSVEEKSALIESALVDGEASVRAAAIVAMRKAKLPSAEFVQRIAARLRDAEGDSVNAIVRAIGAHGSEAVGTLPMLLEALNKEGIDPQLLSQTLANLGPTVVPDLLVAIEKQPSNEPVLSRALGLIGEPAVKALVAGMSSEIELVRVAATRAIGGVRPLNKALLEHLVVAVADESARVREIAVKSLIAAETEADFAKDTVFKAIEDPEPRVRVAAIESLMTFKFNEDQIQAGLERGLRDETPEVRTATLQTLRSLPKLLKSRLPQLVGLIGDADAEVRTMAIQTLGKLDKKDADDSVVTACVKSLGDQNHAVRIAATETVKALAISDPLVLEALSGNLIDDQALLRVTLEAVAGFGEKAAPMIPAIARLAEHEKAELRVAAISALAGIDKDAKQLCGRLTEALNDKEWEVRRVAGVALGKLGPDGKNAVPKLFQLLANDEDRDFASSALKEINTAPIEAIPLLMEKLDSEERRTSFYAVTLLGKIGPPAAEALPKLEEMLTKPGGVSGRSDFRKKFLVEAIAAIKGEAKE